MAGKSQVFKDDFSKRVQSQDIFKKPQSMVKHQDIEEAKKEKYKLWITFYRRNPHRFVEDYFGIKLFPYQVLWIWILQRSNLAYIVASRASAKTWLLAVWSLTLAVLYPNSKITVVAKTLSQGGIILKEKMQSLYDNHPNVKREIKSIITNSNVSECVFRNGSTILVVPGSESARGHRSNFIIVEEARLLGKDILEQVIKPFLTSRMPPYKSNPLYENDPLLVEEGVISYITSCWYTTEYWWEYVKTCIKRMVSGDDTANFMALDYLISIRHGIKTVETIKNEMSDMDEVTIQLEYLNIPSGTSSKSYFKTSQFPRNIKRAFYPQRDETYSDKKNPYAIPKTDGEIRFISVDVASRAGKKNDNTIISCIRCIPMIGKGMERSLLYAESHKGEHTGIQSKRIKEIYHDFEADYIVLDIQNIGISIYDNLSQVTPSDERGINFPPMGVVGREFDFVEEKLREELEGRTLGMNAMPVIFPIAASATLNSQIAVMFRTSLQKKMWNFLIPDGDAETFLIKSQKEFMKNGEDNSYSFFMSPYVQTGLLISECVGLDMVLNNGIVKLSERPGARKDRYSSVSYANFIISQFDTDLLRESQPNDELSSLMAITMVY